MPHKKSFIDFIYPHLDIYCEKFKVVQDDIKRLGNERVITFNNQDINDNLLQISNEQKWELFIKNNLFQNSNVDEKFINFLRMTFHQSGFLYTAYNSFTKSVLLAWDALKNSIVPANALRFDLIQGSVDFSYESDLLTINQHALVEFYFCLLDEDKSNKFDKKDKPNIFLQLTFKFSLSRVKDLLDQVDQEKENNLLSLSKDDIASVKWCMLNDVKMHLDPVWIPPQYERSNFLCNSFLYFCLKPYPSLFNSLIKKLLEAQKNSLQEVSKEIQCDVIHLLWGNSSLFSSLSNLRIEVLALFFNVYFNKKEDKKIVRDINALLSYLVREDKLTIFFKFSERITTKEAFKLLIAYLNPSQPKSLDALKKTEIYFKYIEKILENQNTSVSNKFLELLIKIEISFFNSMLSVSDIKDKKIKVLSFLIKHELFDWLFLLSDEFLEAHFEKLMSSVNAARYFLLLSGVKQLPSNASNEKLESLYEDLRTKFCERNGVPENCEEKVEEARIMLATFNIFNVNACNSESNIKKFSFFNFRNYFTDNKNQEHYEPLEAISKILTIDLLNDPFQDNGFHTSPINFIDFIAPHAKIGFADFNQVEYDLKRLADRIVTVNGVAANNTLSSICKEKEWVKFVKETLFKGDEISPIFINFINRTFHQGGLFYTVSAAFMYACQDFCTDKGYAFSFPDYQYEIDFSYDLDRKMLTVDQRVSAELCIYSLDSHCKKRDKPNVFLQFKFALSAHEATRLFCEAEGKLKEKITLNCFSGRTVSLPLSKNCIISAEIKMSDTVDPIIKYHFSDVQILRPSNQQLTQLLEESHLNLFHEITEKLSNTYSMDDVSMEIQSDLFSIIWNENFLKVHDAADLKAIADLKIEVLSLFFDIYFNKEDDKKSMNVINILLSYFVQEKFLKELCQSPIILIKNLILICVCLEKRNHFDKSMCCAFKEIVLTIKTKHELPSVQDLMKHLQFFLLKNTLNDYMTCSFGNFSGKQAISQLNDTLKDVESLELFSSKFECWKNTLSAQYFTHSLLFNNEKEEAAPVIKAISKILEIGLEGTPENKRMPEVNSALHNIQHFQK